MFLIRFATGLFLLWSATAVAIAIAAFTLTVHGNHDRVREPAASPTPAVERPRPTGVPAGAELVVDDTSFGDLTLPAPGSQQAAHIFYALTCDDHLLTIATTRETIYAELDCSHYWLVHEVVRPFLAQSVLVRIWATTPGMLFVEAIAAGTARFNVDAVWLDKR